MPVGCWAHLFMSSVLIAPAKQDLECKALGDTILFDLSYIPTELDYFPWPHRWKHLDVELHRGNTLIWVWKIEIIA